MTGEDNPSDPGLRAAIERGYDEIQQRKGKPRRDPLKPLRREVPLSTSQGKRSAGEKPAIALKGR